MGLAGMGNRCRENGKTGRRFFFVTCPNRLGKFAKGRCVTNTFLPQKREGAERAFSAPPRLCGEKLGFIFDLWD
jgi:hypothetical protein